MENSGKLEGVEATDSRHREAKILRIRVKSEDSAFVYSIFEASGGICAYSTLDFKNGDQFRDLELVIPIGQLPEVERVLERLKDDLKGHLYALEVPEDRNTKS